MDEIPERSPGFWRGLSRDSNHGPLPAYLMLLTATAGTVDAVSILSLGRVFVANMTGNVVFVAFALAKARGFSLSASLFALGGFLFGAHEGGRAVRRGVTNRAVLLRNTVRVELGLSVIALVIAVITGTPIPGLGADAISAALAIAMGLQNAVVRRLGVPDLTTTVLTMTLTGIAADLSQTSRSVALRRILAVGAMLVGAACGALLVLHVSPSAALGLAVLLVRGGARLNQPDVPIPLANGKRGLTSSTDGGDMRSPSE